MKSNARDAISADGDALVGISREIHAHPELRFEEEFASALAADFLEARGFSVQRGVGTLATAFEATAGSGDLVVALCAEYDALPGIGHACGHNLICGASLGAATGLTAVADELGLTVKVIGTPGEEGGGGKSLLLDAGAFDSVHLALMAHPGIGGLDIADMGWAVEMVCRPGGRCGTNALDAVTIAQTAIGLLRQQLRPRDLVHGFVRHGGDAVNVIPERTVLELMVRAESIEEAKDVERRVSRCVEAGALATGCEVEISSMAPAYSHLEPDRDLTRFYGDAARALGHTVIDRPPPGVRGAASTDMGNVSLEVPAIHPAFGIPDAKVLPHHPDYAAACATSGADASMIDAATALAWTAIDAAQDDSSSERSAPYPGALGRDHAALTASGGRTGKGDPTRMPIHCGHRVTGTRGSLR